MKRCPLPEATQLVQQQTFYRVRVAYVRLIVEQAHLVQMTRVLSLRYVWFTIYILVQFHIYVSKLHVRRIWLVSIWRSGLTDPASLQLGLVCSFLSILRLLYAIWHCMVGTNTCIYIACLHAPTEFVFTSISSEVVLSSRSRPSG